jgi:hypothetical protein
MLIGDACGRRRWNCIAAVGELQVHQLPGGGQRGGRVEWHVQYRVEWHVQYRVEWHVQYRVEWHVQYRVEWHVQCST